MLFVVVAFYLSFKFFTNLLSVFCVVLFLLGHNTNAEMVVKTTENGTAKNGLQAQTSDGWFVGFLKTYLFPDKNPIFQDQQNEISVSYLVSYNEPVGYEAAYIQPGGMFRRAVHSFQMHYQQPDKLLRIHGRLSAGFFTLHGVANYYKHTYQAYGIELIQEFILGTPMLYITAGIGPSYMMGKTGRTGERMIGLTPFNFSSVIKVGHRFRCGAILELHYHHYSNGGLGVVNQGIDMIGMSFGWAF